MWIKKCIICFYWVQFNYYVQKMTLQYIINMWTIRSVIRCTLFLDKSTFSLLKIKQFQVQLLYYEFIIVLSNDKDDTNGQQLEFQSRAKKPDFCQRARRQKCEDMDHTSRDWQKELKRNSNHVQQNVHKIWYKCHCWTRRISFERYYRNWVMERRFGRWVVLWSHYHPRSGYWI